VDEVHRTPILPASNTQQVYTNPILPASNTQQLYSTASLPASSMQLSNSNPSCSSKLTGNTECTISVEVSQNEQLARSVIKETGVLSLTDAGQGHLQLDSVQHNEKSILEGSEKSDSSSGNSSDKTKVKHTQKHKQRKYMRKVRNEFDGLTLDRDEDLPPL
jgi:hypothetical protein